MTEDPHAPYRRPGDAAPADSAAAGAAPRAAASIVPRTSSPEGDVGAPRVRSGLLGGLAAGTIGLACCVGPAVAALLGLTSAAVAIDVANTLFSEWGWAFKLAGGVFAAVAIGLAYRRRRSCGTDARRGTGRFAAVLIATGLATYGVLYAGTTWLGNISEPPIEVTGATLEQRVDSAVAQVEERFPHFDVVEERLGVNGVLFRTRWEVPQGLGGDDYADEVAHRAQDAREATVTLLKALAAKERRLENLGAFEDNMIMPIWERKQILAADDPGEYRSFQKFSAFQLGARFQTGYTVLGR